jgi:drug/metabolite transporter (DMT)-like permease
MLYGSLTLYAAALVSGTPIVLPLERDYLLSLVYLALFGSVIAFWAYVTLIGRIGPDRASYTTLLFPLVALAVSTVFEDYRWSLPAALGLALVLAGNWLAMRRNRS